MKTMATLALAVALAAGLTGAYAAGVLVRVFPPPASAQAPHRAGAPQPADIPLAARVARASPAAWLAVALGGISGLTLAMPPVALCLLIGFWLSAMQRRPRRDVRR